MFFGKAQIKKPHKVILIQIPKLLRLANLIEFKEKVFMKQLKSPFFYLRNIRSRNSSSKLSFQRLMKCSK